MAPTMISKSRYEYAGERWIAPFRTFERSDKNELQLWQAHYARLGIRTTLVPNENGSSLLLVNEGDDLTVWPRKYTWR